MDADSALQWAQANPNDPRAKDVMAKAWAMQNPNDPRSAQIMQKLSAPAQVTPKQEPVDNELTRAGLKPGSPYYMAAMGAKEQTQTPQGVGQLASTLIPGSASVMSKGASLAGRIGTSGLAGGTAAVAMQDPEQPAVDKLKTFLQGGGLGVGFQAAGELGGKVGDYLMQRSTGMRKYMPGVGTSLADQGVMGTRNRMANQVEQKLSAEEQNLQDLVSKLKGNVDAQEIGDAIAQHGERFNLPSTGEVAPNMQSYADKVKSAAGEFTSMGEGGELTPQDLLTVKRQGDWLGYTNSGNPASSLEADLGRAQADKARGLLSDISDEATANSLAKERALILAKKALTKPGAIRQGLGDMGMFSKIPGTSLLESVAGQTAVKGSKAASDPRVLRAIEQSLFDSPSNNQ